MCYTYPMRYLMFRILLAILFVIILTLLILFARGYRFNFTEKTISPTGILFASSSPQGAKIYLNGSLKGATNQNITLAPGRYDVEINKEGYTSWKSNLVVKGEVVTNAAATLFPLNPSLSPVTNLGVVKAQFFPDAEKVVIIADNPNSATESSSIIDGSALEKNGIYVLDNASGPLSLLNRMRLLVGTSKFDPTIDLSQLQLEMAPDGSELLVTTQNNRGLPHKTYLLSTDTANQSLFETTKSKQAIIAAWQKKQTERTEKILETFEKPFFDIALNSFDIVGFSPDETKVLYQSKINTSIPIIIKPRLIGTNQTEEVRDVTRGNLYVYDKKEDKNYEVSSIKYKVLRINETNSAASAKKKPSQLTNILDTKYLILNTILWHPNSTQLIVKGSNDIAIFDFDGAHEQTVYSGPFEKDFLAVTGDGKLLIITNLNPQRNPLPDVYAVGIK